LITTKLIKKASPLMVVLAILAISVSLVGAAVVLSSNVATVQNTVIADNNGAIVITLTGNSAPGTLYATDTLGINYGMSANIPVTLATAKITVVITEKFATTGPLASDIGSVKIIPTQTGYPTYTLALTGSSQYVANSAYATLVYSVDITGPIPSGTALAGNLNIVYNIPGTFDVAASMTGTTNP
jgi:hypothetical protein